MTAQPEFTVVTTTGNAIGLASRFLLLYQKLGFNHVQMMDFDSTAGAGEIPASEKLSAFVELIPFPGIHARIARRTARASPCRVILRWRESPG